MAGTKVVSPTTGAMTQTLGLGPSVIQVLAIVESMARLDVLLFLRSLRGKATGRETVATACRMSSLAAEHHLARLCARGLLAVTIGEELHYSYRPIDPRMRAAVDELDRVSAAEPGILTAWFAAYRRPHALIVEDDADMREILRSFIESRGFQATALAHGRESLAWAETEPLSLAIVDVRPSFAPGLKLARALRQRATPIRTIVTTSLGDVRLHAQLSGLGVSAVLEKPFDLDELAGVIEGSA
ncbi:MAG: response regulator [Labilithrix sp.]